MRVWGIIVLAAAVAGCSPYRYGPGVQSFAESVTAADMASREGYANLRRDFDSRTMAALRANPGRVELSTACVENEARVVGGKPPNPCVLVRVGDRDPQAPPVFALEPETRRQMRALQRYAASLTAITDAADRKALDAAVDEVAGSAGALGAISGTPQGLAIGAAISTAARVGGFALAEGLDASRLRVLRGAVTRADPAVQAVATRMGAAFDELRRARMEELRQQAEFRAERIRPGQRFEAELTPAVANLQTLEQLRRMDAESVGTGIAEAHAALKASLDNRTDDASNFSKSLGELADRVRALREALAKMPGADRT